MIGRLMIAGAVAALVLAIAGCGDDEPEADVQATVVAAVAATVEAMATPTLEPAKPPMVVAASASASDDNSLIVEVEVSLDRPARVYIAYHNDDAGGFVTRTTDTAAAEHTVPVVRLRPLTTYFYDIFTVDEDGESNPGTGGSFTTGELPEALARMELTVEGSPTGLVLFDLEDNPDSYYVALDHDSEVVWYYRHKVTLPDMPVSARTVRQKPNYNLLFLEGGPLGRRFNCCLKEITPLGELVDRLAANPIDKFVNRDFLILSDTEVLYLAHEVIEIDDTENGGEPDTQVLVDSIRVWDQSNDTTREIWNALDHFSLDQRVDWNADRPPIAWQRANSLALGVRGNYIVSLANWDQVISISPDGQSIEWQLGGPDTDYHFLDPADRFYGQHTASELSNGNILIYDNGSGRPDEEGGPYSRALELALNTYDLGVTKVWEYRHDPDLFARGRSSAFRLENGNTIINTESNDSDPPRVIVEVDGDGNEIWKAEIRSPSMRNSFRAYSVESILGERRLSKGTRGRSPRPDSANPCTDEGRVLKLAFYAFFEPVSYSADADPSSDDFKTHMGYEADLLTALEAMSGAGLRFSREPIAPWDDIWLLPAGPEFDIAGGGITILESRTLDAAGNRAVAFTSGHVTFRQSLLVRAGDAARFPTHQELDHTVRVGVLPGTTGEWRLLGLTGLIDDEGVLAAGVRVETDEGEVVADGTSDYMITAAIESPNLKNRRLLLPPSEDMPQVVYLGELTGEPEILQALRDGAIDAVARGEIGNRDGAHAYPGEFEVTALDDEIEHGGFALPASESELLSCMNEKIDFLTDVRRIGYAEWREDPSIFMRRAEAWGR